MRSVFTGAWPLLRASWPHNRGTVLAWSSVGVLLSALGVGCYKILFPDPGDVASMEAAVATNPAVSLVVGPAGDLGSRDGFGAWLNVGLGAFFLAIGMAQLTVRASRGQEDDGQAELFASGVMGRGARLSAAVGLGLAGSLLAGLLAALVGVICGGSWEAQLLVGAVLTVTAWLGVAIAAVTAQLGSDKHTASTLAVGALGVLYVLRGFCYALDLPDQTVWANPLGWIIKTDAATQTRWWPLLPAVVLVALLILAAVALQTGRDFGAGALSPRPGPRRGRARSVLALTWRLNRANAITWICVFVLLGVMFGYFVADAEDTLATNPAIQQLLGASDASQSDLGAQMLVTLLTIMGVAAAVPGVQALFRLRSEETAGRVEPVLATGVARSRTFGAAALLAVVSVAVDMMVGGLLVAVVARASGLEMAFGDVLAQTAVTLPAVWAFTALAAAFVGAWPRGRAITWAVIMASFLLTVLGPMLQLSDWALSASPFHHIPSVTSSDPSWTGLILLSGVDVVLLGLGLVTFRRRDVNT